MHKIFLFLIISILLYAQNPKTFSALGDVVYNNVGKIKKLQKIDDYVVYKKKIQDYVDAVVKVKKEGFILDNGSCKDTMKYLNALKELSQTNDFFVRSVKRDLNRAIENENSKLFAQLINTGLLNEEKSKNEIIDYYFAHSDEVNASGLIQKYLDEDKKLRLKQEHKKSILERKKLREMVKIKRIRKKDKLEQERLQKQLDQEVQKKQLEIRKEHKKRIL